MSFSDLLKPRPEVLSSEGVEGIIDLANVTAAASRKKRPLEARPKDVFALTYPTADLRRVVQQIGMRFSGKPDVPGLFLFEGLKGSGKSHLLLVIYHLFQNRNEAVPWLTAHKLACPLPTDVEVILIKFTDLPLESVWRYLFEKLTGKPAPKSVVQPGLAEVQQVLGERRLVLILDELEQGIRVIADPALRAQNIAFLQMLSEWGNRSDQVTLFASIYSDQQEPGSTLKRVPSCRVQFAHARDRGRVILHRLFENYLEFNVNQAAPLVDSYLSLWQRHATMDVERLRNQMLECFPFSPELLDIILNRVPARGGFQNVRGALGFMSHLVRLHHKTANLLTPAHATLSDKEVCVRLSDLDPSSDLINRARANLEELNRVPLADELASSTLLFTLTGTGRSVGATREELLRALLRPGVDVNVFEQALLSFQKYASYFHTQEGRYYFDMDENADATVEFRSLNVEDGQAHAKLREIWKGEIFREPNAVFFTDADATRTACEALEKNQLRYVLAPRQLQPDERHSLYFGLSVRNRVILLEPRDPAFDLDKQPDLLKWAKRCIAAQNLLQNPADAERRAQYERIAKDDKTNIANAIRRAGLVYARFEKYGATAADDQVELESLGNASSKDDVLTKLSKDVFPVPLMAEH
ncbi:MAG: hypothetical protein ACP5MD_11500, partial [Verrucomicrobiia bacterium]